MLYWFAIAMCAVLTIQFHSYVQPFLIIAIIPFGWIGVMIAHWFYGAPISMSSGFGFVALAGVIVNDSIVMIDFINQRVRRGGVAFALLFVLYFVPVLYLYYADLLAWSKIEIGHY